MNVRVPIITLIIFQVVCLVLGADLLLHLLGVGSWFGTAASALALALFWYAVLKGWYET